jgi:branched-chain amino acid transport system substrate-binding protein
MRRRIMTQKLVVVLALLAAMYIPGQALAQSNNPDQVVVGAVQALKGVFSEAFIQINDGLKDSLEMANEQGGINGKRIVYRMKASNYNVDESVKRFEEIMAEFHPLVVFGCSTGLGLRLADAIDDKYKVLYSSTSFSAKLADSARHPSIFLPGPTYGEQVALLMTYIAKEHPRAKVAFFYSDTAFGRDPIKFGRIMARRLRLKVVDEEMVPLKIQDVRAQVKRLKEKNPDYVIFQGFVHSPVPTVIKQCRELGMTCKFMGTFWTATKKMIEVLGPHAEGYLVVNPYSYWGMQDVPMIGKIMEYNAKHYPEVTYRPNYYMEGFATGLIFVEVLKRADKARELNYMGLVKALRSLTNFQTGGLMAPLTIKNNRFPVARIWKANVTAAQFEPASDWLILKKY